jgi:hypothetical protein
MPEQPLTIPPDININIKRGDTLRIHFTQPGVFCSTDNDDFKPALPNNQKFKSGDKWPKHGPGARPKQDCDAKYYYNTSRDAKCVGPTDGPTPTAYHVIHVG